MEFHNLLETTQGLRHDYAITLTIPGDYLDKIGDSQLCLNIVQQAHNVTVFSALCDIH